MPGRVAEADTPRRPAFNRRPGVMRMLRRKRNGIVRPQVKTLCTFQSRSWVCR